MLWLFQDLLVLRYRALPEVRVLKIHGPLPARRQTVEINIFFSGVSLRLCLFEQMFEKIVADVVFAPGGVLVLVELEAESHGCALKIAEDYGRFMYKRLVSGNTPGIALSCLT